MRRRDGFTPAHPLPVVAWLRAVQAMRAMEVIAAENDEDELEACA
ncbi:hypothetical protein [Leifsonia xyli]|nr:hypothetical protein [Leifsonia xyli]